MKTWTLSVLIALGIPFLSPAATPKVIVHEWGTFTSLQDEEGRAIGGINVDDEPAPSFVYFAGGPVVQRSGRSLDLWRLPPYQDEAREGGRTLPFGDPSVTMRLETPVLYIYPPGETNPRSIPPLKVHVDFLGGILGQYYPYARLKWPPQKAPGLTERTQTSLDWKVVRIGTTLKPIVTSDKVWTTPREVSAPTLAVDAPTRRDAQGVHDAEAEKFLFYRGLGHLDAPLSLHWKDGRIAIVNAPAAKAATYAQAWLIDVQPGGACAFRTVSPFGGGVAAEVAPDFQPADYTADNLGKLQAAMQAVLVKEGLYADEASAMLRTWELSYFKSPGLRFFYIAPRPWVDAVLPLKIAGAPTDITRVMVGRIELVTPWQKALIARLAQGPCPDLSALKKAAEKALATGSYSREEASSYRSGEKALSGLGISIPPLLQDYLDLGRFRDALVVREQQIHPSPALRQFIVENGLAVPTLAANRQEETR